MNSKNILHLVLGNKNGHYKNIEKISRSTWMKKSPDNVKTIFMYGDSDTIYWDEDSSFYVDRMEGHQNSVCLYKTIKAFEFFYESNFDYVYRTNCTGYFDLEIASSFVEDKPIHNFYCGFIGKHQEISFASGASYFLSKDIVKKIIENQDILFSYRYPGWMDDVAIGKFVTEELGIPISNEITSKSLRVIVTPESIEDDLDMSQFHYYLEPRNSKVKNLSEAYIKLLNTIHNLKTNERI